MVNGFLTIHAMTDAELFAGIGQVLAARRRRRGIPDAKRNANLLGLSGNTVLAIESGRARNITKLVEYCRKLNTRLSDVVLEVLADELDDPPLTVSDWDVIGVFRALPEDAREDFLRPARRAVEMADAAPLPRGKRFRAPTPE